MFTFFNIDQKYLEFTTRFKALCTMMEMFENNLARDQKIYDAVSESQNRQVFVGHYLLGKTIQSVCIDFQIRLLQFNSNHQTSREYELITNYFIAWLKDKEALMTRVDMMGEQLAPLQDRELMMEQAIHEDQLEHSDDELDQNLYVLILEEIEKRLLKNAESSERKVENQVGPK